MRAGDADAEALESLILSFLDKRRPGATICPSEVARAAAAAEGSGDWRGLMEPVREAARRLAAQDRLEITQGGRRVDLRRAHGPLRLGVPGGGRRESAVEPDQQDGEQVDDQGEPEHYR